VSSEGAWAASAGGFDAEVHETHSGVVFLAGSRAYKLKKPLDLGFLDFTRLADRERACRREVELNRRLSPDVYLGLGRLREPDGAEEPLVVMRRMPADRRLANLARKGALPDAELRELAHLLASFHSRSDHQAVIDAEGSMDRLWARWSDSFRQVRPFHGRLLDPEEALDIERLTARYLAGREALFDARIRRGCIVDGHGDLVAEDVFCLDDGPRVLDCLEFDDKLRYVDRIDDAAFLAMDLEHLGAPDQASAFLGWYLELSGDTVPPSLVHHYIAYRAFVRTKVACLRVAQGDGAFAEEARSLTSLTRRHLVTAAVTLTLVGGLPGTGKSTLAAAVADRFGMVVLSSDRLRKELADRSPEQPAASGYREGIYSPEWTRRTYAELLHRAGALLGMGESVVLDASWTDSSRRADARLLAERCSADLVELCCDVPAEVADPRIKQRAGPSDADPVTRARMARDMAPWPEAYAVHTTAPVESTMRTVLGCFGRRETPVTRPALRR
jgi:aminoglycoside phosphotransferase family enzyme/predicted kinase